MVSGYIYIVKFLYNNDYFYKIIFSSMNLFKLNKNLAKYSILKYNIYACYFAIDLKKIKNIFELLQQTQSDDKNKNTITNTSACNKNVLDILETQGSSQFDTSDSSNHTKNNIYTQKNIANIEQKILKIINKIHTKYEKNIHILTKQVNDFITQYFEFVIHQNNDNNNDNNDNLIYNSIQNYKLDENYIYINDMYNKFIILTNKHHLDYPFFIFIMKKTILNNNIKQIVKNKNFLYIVTDIQWKTKKNDDIFNEFSEYIHYKKNNTLPLNKILRIFNKWKNKKYPFIKIFKGNTRKKILEILCTYNENFSNNILYNHCIKL